MTGLMLSSPGDPRTRTPIVVSALVALLIAAVACGTLIAFDVVPPGYALAGLAGAAVLVLLWPYHRGYPLLLLIATVPLFPVTTIGPLLGALGGHGSQLRSLMIGTMLVAAFVAWRGKVPKPPPMLRPIVIGFAILAALGLLDAYANASALQSFGSLAEQLVGQPAAYATLLVLLCGYLVRDGAKARDLVLVAVSAGIAGEALAIAAELLSGGAYDALRGFTRAQGTTGANFVSAFAMMGLFVGLAERTRGQAGRGRLLWWIGNLTVLAAGFVLVAAVARGGVLGAALGVGYLMLADPPLRRRAPVIVGTAAALLLLSIPTPVGDLWTGRLTSQSVQEFDRPATWVSGARIGLDHPWTGLGELEIVDALADVPEYRLTPFGETYVLPHNSWILNFAEGGFPALLVLTGMTILLLFALRAPPGGRTREERMYVAALIGIFAVAMINNVFRHPELMVPVLVLVSLISVREPRLASPPARGVGASDE